MHVQAIRRDYDRDDPIPNSSGAFVGTHGLHRSTARAPEIAVDPAAIAIQLICIDLGKLRRSGDDSISRAGSPRDDTYGESATCEGELTVNDIEAFNGQRVGLLKESIVRVRGNPWLTGLGRLVS